MNIKQSILDSAFSLAKKAYGASGHANAKEMLEKEYPEASWDEILDAYLKACDLVEKSYEIAEEARLKNISDNESLKIMEKRCPGFTEKTCNDALSLGWFRSR